LVYKRSYGASSIGVSLVETPQVARSIINRELRAPTNKLRKAVKHCVRKLNLPYRQPDGYVYFQQYIESDSDLRIVTFGDSVVSVFRRLNRPHDFRASGSGLWEQITEPAFPVDACDLSIDISRRHGFPVMSYDFLFHKGRWLVSEISYTFLLNNIYVDTLFRRTQFGYQKLGPIQMGVNHICAIIGHDLS
jgi:glutathione synthase/RimK-type ligase-like ATP-grasp enzyme